MNLSRWIGHWADFQPDKTAIRFEGNDISYAALNGRIQQVAALLRDGLSVDRGDRIAFLGLNSPDMLVLLFACARIGAILVPMNWRLAPPEHLYILKNAGAKILFCEEEFAQGIDSIADALTDCRIVAMDAEFNRLASDAAHDAFDADAGPNDPLLIVYTSGTTGRPKGAVLTQHALTVNAANSAAMHDMTNSDVIFTNLPLFHVGGLNIQTTPAFHAGATVILHRRFDPGETMRVIDKEKPSLMILVPAMMSAVMQHPGWNRLDLSCLRALTTGSTTVPLSLIDAYQDRGVPVIQIYGSTETAPIVIHQRIPDAWSNKGSTGRAALHCDAKIIDAAGNTLDADEKGEIAVRGANIMTEYWNDSEATDEVLQDGWFRTGDIGHIDSDGLYYVDDRVKDVVVSGSENIYPAELERVLDRCTDIAESAVVGRSDERWGEVPVAIVVAVEDAHLTRQDVLALFEGELARFKHPRDVVFRKALPRNVMGKVLKYELRATLGQPSPETISGVRPE